MDGAVCLDINDYVYDRLTYFAKVHNINDTQDIDFWYATFMSYYRDEMRHRIETGDYNSINLEESISTLEDILSRKYG